MRSSGALKLPDLADWLGVETTEEEDDDGNNGSKHNTRSSITMLDLMDMDDYTQASDKVESHTIATVETTKPDKFDPKSTSLVSHFGDLKQQSTSKSMLDGSKSILDSVAQLDVNDEQLSLDPTIFSMTSTMQKSGFHLSSTAPKSTLTQFDAVRQSRQNFFMESNKLQSFRMEETKPLQQRKAEETNGDGGVNSIRPSISTEDLWNIDGDWGTGSTPNLKPETKEPGFESFQQTGQNFFFESKNAFRVPDVEEVNGIKTVAQMKRGDDTQEIKNSFNTDENVWNGDNVCIDESDAKASRQAEPVFEVFRQARQNFFFEDNKHQSFKMSDTEEVERTNVEEQTNGDDNNHTGDLNHLDDDRKSRIAKYDSISKSCPALIIEENEPVFDAVRQSRQNFFFESEKHQAFRMEETQVVEETNEEEETNEVKLRDIMKQRRDVNGKRGLQDSFASKWNLRDSWTSTISKPTGLRTNYVKPTDFDAISESDEESEKTGLNRSLLELPDGTFELKVEERQDIPGIEKSVTEEQRGSNGSKYEEQPKQLQQNLQRTLSAKFNGSAASDIMSMLSKPSSHGNDSTSLEQPKQSIQITSAAKSHASLDSDILSILSKPSSHGNDSKSKEKRKQSIQMTSAEKHPTGTSDSQSDGTEQKQETNDCRKSFAAAGDDEKPKNRKTKKFDVCHLEFGPEFSSQAHVSSRGRQRQQKNRSRGRSRPREKSRTREKSCTREKSHTRDKSRTRNKSRTRDKSRPRSRSRQRIKEAVQDDSLDDTIHSMPKHTNRRKIVNVELYQNLLSEINHPKASDEDGKEMRRQGTKGSKMIKASQSCDVLQQQPTLRRSKSSEELKGGLILKSQSSDRLDSSSKAMKTLAVNVDDRNLKQIGRKRTTKRTLRKMKNPNSCEGSQPSSEPKAREDSIDDELFSLKKKHNMRRSLNGASGHTIRKHLTELEQKQLERTRERLSASCLNF